MVSTTSEFGIPVLKALGIDAKHVTGFVITCQVGDLPTIEVTTVLPQSAGEAAAQVLRKFNIVEREEVKIPDVDESVDLLSLTRTTHRLADSQESGPT